eukprot:maker-scaffold886_size84816-snap-gene-0.24 protein:Tk01966 transcript:maker-scaffold886_size84816-snap-gene-0.24-mRNA-1 annotation:"sister chromatid cohesion protein dcc1"
MAVPRTIQEVDRVVGHAKLDPSELLPHSQIIHFGPELLDLRQIRLVEMEASLARSLTEGQVLTFRGRENDNVVLCTPSQTYDVKEAETSNSLLLLDRVDFPEDWAGLDSLGHGERDTRATAVRAVSSRYWELKPCRPSFKRLYVLLRAEPLKNARDAPSGSGMALDQLLEQVQCSESELLEALCEMPATFFCGRWHWLDLDYRMKLLTLITNFMEENSWTAEELNVSHTLETLGVIEPVELIRQTIDYYFPEPGKLADQRQVNPDRVAKFYGQYLLQSGSAFALDEFVRIWQQSVPEGVKVNLQLLNDLALVDKQSSPVSIKSFDEKDLPENIGERLAVLFLAREKWTVEELDPFVQKLTTPKLNVNALLTKFARASKVEGVKYFGAKHAK